MIHQIIYSSVASTPMQLDELEDILEQARDNNTNSGITGALVYVDGFFLQILEGDKNSVLELMRRISDDVRHETMTILQAGDIPGSTFADWKMAYVGASPEQVANWAGLSVTTKLPEIWDTVRQDRDRAMQLARGILLVLVDGARSEGY